MRLMQSGKIILSILLFAPVALFLLYAVKTKPLPSFPLSDGTKLTLTATDSGKQLRFFHGSVWQKFLYSIVNTNLPYKFRGSKSVDSSRYTNGSIGLLFARSEDSGVLRRAVNGSVRLVAFNQNGIEQNVNRRFVNFKTSTSSGRTKVIAEEILWEIPMTKQKELRLRLYETNSFTQEVSTNDCVVKNPADF